MSTVVIKKTELSFHSDYSLTLKKRFGVCTGLFVAITAIALGVLALHPIAGTHLGFFYSLGAIEKIGGWALAGVGMGTVSGIGAFLLYRLVKHLNAVKKLKQLVQQNAEDLEPNFEPIFLRLKAQQRSQYACKGKRPNWMCTWMSDKKINDKIVTFVFQLVGTTRKIDVLTVSDSDHQEYNKLYTRLSEETFGDAGMPTVFHGLDWEKIEVTYAEGLVNAEGIIIEEKYVNAFGEARQDLSVDFKQLQKAGEPHRYMTRRIKNMQYILVYDQGKLSLLIFDAETQADKWTAKMQEIAETALKPSPPSDTN
jgi:hypothetical protein